MQGAGLSALGASFLRGMPVMPDTFARGDTGPSGTTPLRTAELVARAVPWAIPANRRCWNLHAVRRVLEVK
jgi:hypothetical protein